MAASLGCSHSGGGGNGGGTPVAAILSLSSVQPNSGGVGLGVTLVGTGFSTAATTRVTFAGVQATSVAVNSSQSITCDTPTNPLGAVNVTVSDTVTGHSSTLANGFTYTSGPGGGGGGGG
ncbi:MAG TPA: IPT/TIG domain-containing protein, partial [Planctomycetota bacterium]|nr:IPT/TIG domain-containing protein [Planctomycetota bacterium]